MSCESNREVLVGLGTADERQKLRAALEHEQTCSDCRIAMRDFDRLAGILGPVAAEEKPMRGWENFERDLQRSFVPHRARLTYWPVALAACVLLAVMGFEIGRRSSSRPQAVAAQIDRFNPSDLNTNVKAFQQVSQVFDGHASWLLVSHQASDVGIASGQVATMGRVLLLHLSVSRGGVAVSDADLLIVPGQTADLRVPLEADQSLHYRISASTDLPTHLAIWLEAVGSHSQQTLGALATTLQAEPGEKMNAGELTTSAGSYQLRIGFAEADTAGEHS
jgi:hypothetical protein